MLIAGITSVAVGVGLFSVRARWVWIVAVVAMGLAVGAAAWALVRHGLDGIVWATAVGGLIAFAVLAHLLRRDVRGAFSA